MRNQPHPWSIGLALKVPGRPYSGGTEGSQGPCDGNDHVWALVEHPHHNEPISLSANAGHFTPIT